METGRIAIGAHLFDRLLEKLAVVLGGLTMAVARLGVSHSPTRARVI